jgi:hypothetical protein
MISSKDLAPSGGRRAGACISAALCLCAGLWSAAAHAQRGEAYALDEELAVRRSPDDGFPGLFDTQLAREGAFIVNLPASSVYYGVTRDLTLGTVLWSYLPLAYGRPGASGLARYRLGSSSWFRSTADVVLAGFAVESDDHHSNAPVGIGMLGSNTEFALNRWNRVTATVWLGHVIARETGGRQLGVTALSVGGSYSLVLASWASLNATGLYLVSGTAAADSYGGSADVDWLGVIRPSDRLFARGMLSLRSGSWLFNLGGMRLGSSVLPWINIAFEVGG